MKFIQHTMSTSGYTATITECECVGSSGMHMAVYLQIKFALVGGCNHVLKIPYSV